MAIRIRAFIDSNVIANWMLIDAAIQEIGQEGEAALSALRERTEVINRWPSYRVLEEYGLPIYRTKFEFGISAFAFAETSRVILDEYINGILHDRIHVPIQFITKALRKKVRLSPEEEHDLTLQVARFLTIFFEPKNEILAWFEGCDFATASILITSARISTTDAYLVGSGLYNKCNYFVTEDEALRRLMKETNVHNIEPVSAQAMLSNLKALP